MIELTNFVNYTSETCFVVNNNQRFFELLPLTKKSLISIWNIFVAISDHLTILSQEEISQLYDLPKIEEEDRALFFEITAEDEVYLNKQTIVNNKINYLLQVGYFRATRNFYKFTFQQVKDDLFNNLTLLKKDPKNFKTKKMQKKLSKQRKILALFNKSKLIIPLLNISRQNIQYYTGLSEFYETNILQKLNRKKVRLYLICFVWQRFVKLNDHLTSFFIHKMSTYEDLAKAYAQACVLEAKLGIDPARKTASKILKIIANHEIVPDNIRPSCYEIIDQKNFSVFAEKLTNPSIDERDYAWAYYDNEFSAIKTNLRSIFTALEFNSEQQANLGSAIEFMQQLILGKGKVEDIPVLGVPLAFASSGIAKYLIYKKTISGSGKRSKKVKFININRYEVILYQQIAKELTYLFQTQ